MATKRIPEGKLGEKSMTDQDSVKMKTEELISSPKPKTSTSECKFCCENKPSSEFTVIKPCDHQICTVCITHYCTTNIASFNVDHSHWLCPYDDGWFKPIIDEDAWRKNVKHLSFWENIMFKLTVPKQDREMKMMARVKQWRRCPRCHFYIQKIDGCSQISCRCGKQFCYDCGRSFWMCFCNSIIINRCFNILGLSGRRRRYIGTGW